MKEAPFRGFFFVRKMAKTGIAGYARVFSGQWQAGGLGEFPSCCGYPTAGDWRLL